MLGGSAGGTVAETGGGTALVLRTREAALLLAVSLRSSSPSQVRMHGDTFSIQAPKECSKKFAATLRRKFLTRGNVLEYSFCS